MNYTTKTRPKPVYPDWLISAFQSCQ